jgi:tricorn protease interacting factor F2/3
MERNRYRLGDNVVPKAYRLYFEPNANTLKFNGVADITVSIAKPTKEIVLNSKELQIKKVSVKNGGGSLASGFRLDEKYQQLFVTVPKPIKGGSVLHIEFTGMHTDRMAGFYASRYSDGGRRQKVMLTTHFESSDARSAFPCFDEPSMKAAYDVSILVDKGLSAVSNMPIKKESSAGSGKKLVAFRTTPMMSSYLLYIGVGDFEFVEGKAGALPVRVVTTPGKKHLSRMALQYAISLIAMADKYFGIRYPLPKMDLIAVPDFAAGAMENWGAITFRESYLLGDESNTSLQGKHHIADTIAHEFTHQWFGDMVTMKWWDDLWLNESFATIKGYEFTDEMTKAWRSIGQFFARRVSGAFDEDQLMATHPISVNVRSADDVNSIFDGISYDKGSVVLYMLEHFLGREAFRDGLHRYLKRHKYANATKHDLWRALQEASSANGMKLPVVETIKEWIEEPGYPIITVMREKGGFKLRQKRFLLSGASAKGRWNIPVTYFDGEKEAKFLMKDKNHTLKSDADWIKLNYGQTGLFRVGYDDATMDGIGRAIKSGILGDRDAWGVVNDLFATVRTGRTPLGRYLDFAYRYLLDTGYPANVELSGHLGWLYLMLHSTKLGAEVRELSLRFHRHILDKTGWIGKGDEDPENSLLRTVAIGALGTLGDKDVLSRSNGMFDAFADKGTQIPSDIKGAVYRNAVRSGNQKSTDSFMLSLYSEKDFPEDKAKALAALGATANAAKAKRILDMSLSEKVRKQDAYILHVMVSGNVECNGIVWDWTKRNWKRLLKTYDSVTLMLPRYVEDLAMVSDSGTLKDIERFFSKKGNMRDDLTRSVAKTRERIESNIAFMKKNAPK